MDQLHAKSGCLYIIGCLLRPGALTYATDLEHTYFSPDTEQNCLYNIFQLQYCGMPYYIVEIPHSSYTISKELANKCKLKMVTGKPSSTKIGDPPFGLICNNESCYTLESIHVDHKVTSDWQTELKIEQENVRQRLKMTPTDIGNEQESN